MPTGSRAKPSENGLQSRTMLDEGVEDVIEDLSDYTSASVARDVTTASAEPEPARPETITGRRRVAIIGYTGHREEAPFGDDSWEFWGMNNLWHFMPQGQGKYKWHAWFDLHDIETVLRDDDMSRAHLEWLQQRHDFPVLMMENTVFELAAKLGAQPWLPGDEHAVDMHWWQQKLPSVELFPAPMLLEKLKVGYFTNTPAWETALAVVALAGHPGSEIGLWGVDMAVNTEYSRQRPSVEFYLGIAAGQGISVTIPQASDLLKAASMYGDPKNPLLARMRFRQKELQLKLDQVRQRAAQLQHELGELSGMEHQLVGAMEQQTYYLSVWGIPEIADRDHTDDVLLKRAASVLGEEQPALVTQ